MYSQFMMHGQKNIKFDKKLFMLAPTIYGPSAWYVLHVVYPAPGIVMWILDVCRTAVRHTYSHRTHVHTPNVMLPHHHTYFYIFYKF